MTVVSDLRTGYQASAPAPYCWYAYDRARYDGAPDASARSRAIGRGRSEAEAIEDLFEQLEAAA